MMDAVADPLLGRTLGGKYEIEARVGEGSMGVVYRARQTSLDKIVALKVLHRDMAHEESFVARFRREALAASRLDHPSSVRIFDFGEEDDGTLYIAMEYVEGRDLQSLVATERRLEPRRIAIILSQVLAALAVAHRSGVIHRDLKPENILVFEGTSDDGEVIDLVKVCDFGIAAIGNVERGRFAPALTAKGTVVGTPEYMSPEQVRGDPLDARADLYSLGVVLYEMLVGQQPFSGDTPVAVAIQHVSSPVPVPSSVYPDVDRALESICMRAMAKDRESRFQSASEMRTALRRAIESRGSHIPGVPSVRPPPEQVRVDTLGSVGIDANEVVLRSEQQLPPASPSNKRRFVVAAVAAAIAFAGASAARTHKVDALATSLAAQPVSVAETQTIAEPIANAQSIASVPEMQAAPRKVVALAKKPAPTATAKTSKTSIEPAAPEPAPVAVVSANVPAEAPAPTATPIPTAVEKAAEAKPVPTATAAPITTGTVQIGAIKTTNAVPTSSVRMALSHAAILTCYRNALSAGAHDEGSAVLHLSLDDTGRVISATLAGPLSKPLRACVEGSSRGLRVKGVDTGDATADVGLVFQAQ